MHEFSITKTLCYCNAEAGQYLQIFDCLNRRMNRISLAIPQENGYYKNNYTHKSLEDKNAAWLLVMLFVLHSFVHFVFGVIGSMDQLKHYRCHKCMNEIADPGQPCAICGWHQDTPAPEGALQPETLLADRYFVGRAAYQNAECFVYAAYDRAEDARVWLREFYPHQIARRGHTGHEVLFAAENRIAFEDWREDFRQLYADLKKVGHLHAVTPVVEMFEEGNTV